MNRRRPSDYSAFLKYVVDKVDTFLSSGEKTEEKQIQLYWSIGEAICARPERSAAVVLSEELARTFPEEKGFSPRNVRRMREFYHTYADCPVLAALVFAIGWTSNVLIMEHCRTTEERESYLKAIRRTNWSKTELLRSFDKPEILQTVDFESLYTKEPREQPVSAKRAVSVKEPSRAPSAPCEAAVPACGATEAVSCRFAHGERLLQAGDATPPISYASQTVGEGIAVESGLRQCYRPSPFGVSGAIGGHQLQGVVALAPGGFPVFYPYPSKGSLNEFSDSADEGHQGKADYLHWDPDKANQQQIGTGYPPLHPENGSKTFSEFPDLASRVAMAPEQPTRSQLDYWAVKCSWCKWKSPEPLRNGLAIFISRSSRLHLTVPQE